MIKTGETMEAAFKKAAKKKMRESIKETIRTLVQTKVNYSFSGGRDGRISSK